MRSLSMMPGSRWLLRGLVGLVAICGLAQAKEPKVGVTRFKNIPSRISYFDDTTVSLRSLRFPVTRPV
jgi:hypothetical protein